MGSFRITSGAVQSQSGVNAWSVGGVPGVAPPPDDDLLAILNRIDPWDPNTFIASFPPGDVTPASIRLLPIGSASGIYLDGSVTPTPENNLPLGFHVVQTPNIQLTTHITKNVDSSFNLQIGALVGTTNSSILSYPLVPPLSLSSILTSPIQLDWQPAGVSSAVVAYFLRITGFYDIITFSWSIANGIDLPDGVKGFGPEKEFIIESEDIFDPSTNPTGKGPCLLVVTGIVFYWNNPVTDEPESLTILPADFDDDWSCLRLKFILPDTLPTDIPINVDIISDAFPPILPPEGTGIQFEGSVLLGSIAILDTLASGLYKIVSGKTDDTMYVDVPNSDDTVEMAIPDPFAKTGFIGNL